MTERAESAPAGRLDTAPLGRQQKRINGERPLPMLPRQATKAAERIKDGFLRKPPLNARTASTGTPSSIRDNSITYSSNQSQYSSSPPTNNTSGNKRRPLFQSDPLADRCSIALGRTESILVSAAGDVLVCRCRRSSMPYISTERQDPLNPMILNLIPCCEADCGGNFASIEGPWSPVFDSLVVTRQISNAEMSQTSEASVYEWEAMSEKSSRSNPSTHNKNPPTRSLSPFQLQKTSTPTTSETTTASQSTNNINTLKSRIGSLTINTDMNDNKNRIPDERKATNE